MPGRGSNKAHITEISDTLRTLVTVSDEKFGL